MLKKKHWGLFAASVIVMLLIVLRCLRSYDAAPGIFWKRFQIILLFEVYIAANCFYGIRRLHDFIYRHRLILCILLLMFCVANKFNNSSITMWDFYIEPGKGSQYIHPIFGNPRAIRSDEWMVNLPRMMSGYFASNYGKYNDIVMAAKFSNLSSSGFFRDYGALAVPHAYGYYLLGPEYGLSFSWSFRMIFGMLFSFELCMMISNKNRLLSLLGASLIWFSPFNMWWSISQPMMSCIASIVLFNYFITAENWKKRFIFGILLALSGADFIVGLYPAWQVPFGWIMIGFMICIIISNWDNIRNFRKSDWLVFVFCLCFMISIAGRYLYNELDYIAAVGNTVYPGKRVSYGGFSLLKTQGYLAAVLSIFNYSTNPSEMGCFYCAFPLGFILLVIQLIHEKQKNIFHVMLVVIGSVLTLYCSIHLPKMIVKLFMLTYSTPSRAVDVLGFLSVLALVSSLSSMYNSHAKLDMLSSIIIASGCVIPAVIISIPLVSGNKNILAVYVLGIITFVSIMLLIHDGRIYVRKYLITFATACMAINGLLVNPILSGTDVITTKPLYTVIRDIVKKDPEARWITLDDSVYSQYLISCGARTINSVNFVPNFELWKKIDPENVFRDVWDRYAHMAIHLSEAERFDVRLNYPDSITVDVDEKSFEKMDVNYILSVKPVMDKKWADKFDNVYEENGLYIYQVKK